MKRCLQCNKLYESPTWTCPSCNFEPVERNGLKCFAPELKGQFDDYNPKGYATISRFQKEHFWFRGRNELICRQLDRFFPAAKSLLEVGCGTGQVLGTVRQFRPDIRLYGTEIHTCGLTFAQNCFSGIEFFQMDARRIPFQDEFDAVCAFDVIEHVDDDLSVLRQLHDACRSGGGIMITVPQHRWLWSSKDETACHKRRYVVKDLCDKVRETGFEVVMTTSFVSLLLPLMYLSRLRHRTKKNGDAHSELHISRVINSVFLACSRLENRLIQTGVRLPVGGSLMLVGRKK